MSNRQNALRFKGFSAVASANGLATRRTGLEPATTGCGSPKTKPLPPAPPPVDIASEIADVVVFVHHAAYIYFAAMGVFLLGVLLALVALMFV